MTEQRCKAYPCILYHPTKAPTGRSFSTEEEVIALGPKWVDSPSKLPHTSKLKALLISIKPWWTEWEWTFKAFAVILGLIGAFILLLKVYYS